MAIRDPLYREIADIIIETDERPPRMVVQEISRSLRRFLPVKAQADLRYPMALLCGGLMRTLQVDLGERSYPIILAVICLGQGDLFASHIAGRQVAIVTNRHGCALCIWSVCCRRSVAMRLSLIVLPDGEAFKDLGNTCS